IFPALASVSRSPNPAGIAGSRQAVICETMTGQVVREARMTLRRMVGSVFGRKPAKAGPWRGDIEDAPRMKISATPKDAERLLRNYDAGRPPQGQPEKAPSLDEPY